jgi:primosomal protein N'
MRFPFAEIHFALPFHAATRIAYRKVDALAQIGCRVLVPLGKRIATGFVVQRTDKIDFAPEKLRDILDRLEGDPKTLLEEWQRKLALKFDENGKIVPRYPVEVGRER